MGRSFGRTIRWVLTAGLGFMLITTVTCHPADVLVLFSSGLAHSFGGLDLFFGGFGFEAVHFDTCCFDEFLFFDF